MHGIILFDGTALSIAQPAISILPVVAWARCQLTELSGSAIEYAELAEIRTPRDC